VENAFLPTAGGRWRLQSCGAGSEPIGDMTRPKQAKGVVLPSERISNRSGLKYALSYAAKVWKKGIGLSKREIYKLNGGRSPVVHSYSTFNRYTGVVRDFVKFCIEEKGLSKLKHVSYETVKEYLERKIEKGYSAKTLKVNATALRKFFNTVGKEEIAEKIGKDYYSFYKEGAEARHTRGFSNPLRVISNLKDPVHKLIAELQFRTGARVGDVKKIQIDEENKRVVITKSKGGRTRVIDFKELGKYDPDKLYEFERIAELKKELNKALKERDWKEIRGGGGSIGSYYKDLRQAAKKAQESYGGAHSFRANYAENFWKWGEMQGWDRDKIASTLEEHLGHSRVYWSRLYAGR